MVVHVKVKLVNQVNHVIKLCQPSKSRIIDNNNNNNIFPIQYKNTADRVQILEVIGCASTEVLIGDTFNKINNNCIEEDDFLINTAG